MHKMQKNLKSKRIEIAIAFNKIMSTFKKSSS